MAKAAKVLESVIGMVAKADGGKSPVDLAGVIVEAVKRLAADSDFIKAAVAALRAAGVKIPEAEGDAGATETTGTEGTDEEAVTGDPEGAPAPEWCYGGYNGSRHKIADDAALAAASLKGDTLSFSWEKGGCEQLGAASKSDANETMACLFLENGRGGKFEWVSTSRKTRSVKNIKNGYEGWPTNALDGGGKLWFCICGKGGKRTALVEVVRK